MRRSMFKGKLWDEKTNQWVRCKSTIGKQIRWRAAMRIQRVIREHIVGTIPRYLSMDQNRTTYFLNDEPRNRLQRLLRTCVLEGDLQENTLVQILYMLPKQGVTRLIQYANRLADEAYYANEIEELWGCRQPQKWNVVALTANRFVHNMRLIELAREIQRRPVVKEISNLERRTSMRCLREKTPLCHYTTHYVMTFV